MKSVSQASSCFRPATAAQLWFCYQLWFRYPNWQLWFCCQLGSSRLGLRSLAAIALFGTTLGTTLLGGIVKPTQAQSVQNPIIQVGVVQRFAAAPTDVMTLKPLAGDRLTLKFETSGQVQTITTADPVKVEVVAQPLAEPQVTEQVVLSTHRSFESAEDSANQWRAKGIEVEIAQPDKWQVWAKRETYRSPLLRRLLMQNLRANGARTAFLDTDVARQDLRASFVVGGFRYQRQTVEIDSGNDRIEVTFNRDDHGRRLYGGSVKLQPNAYGDYTLVNHVPIETYLRGVVPHEIGAGAPPTAIEAQAILARTYALRNLRRFAIDNYQLCADTQCQVYWGLNGTDPGTDRAIAATSGMILAYQNELVDALYSSTTGGVTAPFTDVWNGTPRPYLTAVVDAVSPIWDLAQKSLADEGNFRAFISQKQGFNELGWEMFRWRINNSLTEIAEDVRAYLRSKQHPLANFTAIRALEVTERSTAGRVIKMQVTTDRGTIQLEKDEILRALYAPNSTLFYLEPIYDAAAAKPQAKAAAAKATTPATPPKSVNTPSAAATGQPGQAALAQTPAQTPAAPPPTLKGYTFVGGGFGHGVGMSQTGAYRLGRLGWNNQQILSFYFPGAEVVPLSESIVFWREPQ